MIMTKEYVTDSSVWKFDEEAKLFLRLPRNENPNHPNVPYWSEWTEYDDLLVKDYGDKYLLAIITGKNIPKGGITFWPLKEFAST